MRVGDGAAALAAVGVVKHRHGLQGSAQGGFWHVAVGFFIVGGGIIGLEMGTVYSTLGARLDVVEMMDGLMQGADRDLVKVWQKMNAHRFDNIMLNTKTVGPRPHPKASR